MCITLVRISFFLRVVSDMTFTDLYLFWVHIQLVFVFPRIAKMLTSVRKCAGKARIMSQFANWFPHFCSLGKLSDCIMSKEVFAKNSAAGN